MTESSVFFLPRDKFLFARDNIQKSARDNPKMGVTNFKVRIARKICKKRSKNSKKSARDKQKVPVTNRTKNVSRALFGVTGKKKNTALTQ